MDSQDTRGKQFKGILHTSHGSSTVMDPVENVTVAGKHGKLCRGSANQVIIGAVIGVLPIEIEQSLGIASWMAPSNSWTATLKNVTARPIVDSLMIWV